MVKLICDNAKHTVIEIVHYITEFDLEHSNVPRELIIDEEIKLMEKELKDYFPDFHLVYSYPQRKIMAPPKDETYEKAIHKYEDMGPIGKGLRVITRGVKYKHF